MCKDREVESPEVARRLSPDSGGWSDEQPVFPLIPERLPLSAAETDEAAEKPAGRCFLTVGYLWGYPRLEQPGQLKVTAVSGVHLHPVTHQPSPFSPTPEGRGIQGGFYWGVVTVQSLPLSSPVSFPSLPHWWGPKSTL